MNLTSYIYFFLGIFFIGGVLNPALSQDDKLCLTATQEKQSQDECLASFAYMSSVLEQRDGISKVVNSVVDKDTELVMIAENHANYKGLELYSEIVSALVNNNGDFNCIFFERESQFNELQEYIKIYEEFIKNGTKKGSEPAGIYETYSGQKWITVPLYSKGAFTKEEYDELPKEMKSESTKFKDGHAYIPDRLFNMPQNLLELIIKKKLQTYLFDTNLNEGRDQEMAKNIKNFYKEKNCKKGIIITGKLHVKLPSSYPDSDTKVMGDDLRQNYKVKTINVLPPLNENEDKSFFVDDCYRNLRLNKRPIAFKADPTSDYQIFPSAKNFWDQYKWNDFDVTIIPSK